MNQALRQKTTLDANERAELDMALWTCMADRRARTLEEIAVLIPAYLGTLVKDRAIFYAQKDWFERTGASGPNTMYKMRKHVARHCPLSKVANGLDQLKNLIKMVPQKEIAQQEPETEPEPYVIVDGSPVLTDAGLELVENLMAENSASAEQVSPVKTPTAHLVSSNPPAPALLDLRSIIWNLMSDYSTYSFEDVAILLEDSEFSEQEVFLALEELAAESWFNKVGHIKPFMYTLKKSVTKPIPTARPARVKSEDDYVAEFAVVKPKTKSERRIAIRPLTDKTLNERILDLLADGETHTRAEMMELFGYSASGVEKATYDMLREGVIVKRGFNERRQVLLALASPTVVTKPAIPEPTEAPTAAPTPAPTPEPVPSIPSGFQKAASSPLIETMVRIKGMALTEAETLELGRDLIEAGYGVPAEHTGTRSTLFEVTIKIKGQPCTEEELRIIARRLIQIGYAKQGE